MYQQSEKNLLNSNTSSTCPDNIVHFGLLTAEICWQVWGTPANFNGFRILAALLHGSGRQPNLEAFNRNSHLYSAGRPSRWALAHILVPIISIKNKGSIQQQIKGPVAAGICNDDVMIFINTNDSTSCSKTLKNNISYSIINILFLKCSVVTVSETDTKT